MLYVTCIIPLVWDITLAMTTPFGSTSFTSAVILFITSGSTTLSNNKTNVILKK